MRYDQFLYYSNKGDKIIVVSDTQGYFTVLRGYKIKKASHGGMFEVIKTRLYSGSKSPILGMSRHQHNVLFV